MVKKSLLWPSTATDLASKVLPDLVDLRVHFAVAKTASGLPLSPSP
jgi:hypothetical protein